MKYKDYNGPIEKLITMKLNEIQQQENVRILHAVESGSRAWGFASPDSDYDVRFVYIRPMEYYLGLQKKKDFIDWELDETLDINGWDISKALQHFYKSNATLFEWSNSPVVYQTTSDWEKVKEIAEKYFYVLRPILACKWIEKRQCPPPVLFDELVQEVLEEDMKAVVDRLLGEKTQMVEAEKGPRIDEINAYILENLADFKVKSEMMEDDRNGDWEEINKVFLRLLQK